jgi:hypothetical protein
MRNGHDMPSAVVERRRFSASLIAEEESPVCIGRKD